MRVGSRVALGDSAFEPIRQVVHIELGSHETTLADTCKTGVFGSFALNRDP